MNEADEGNALNTLSAAVELALEQPFLCFHPGCSQRFSNPNRLDAHRLRHNMALAFGKDPVATPTGENTPTPTRFLRGDDALGLFSELHDPNPFDESFRHINVGKDITEALSVVGDSSDVLTTPVIPVTSRVSSKSEVGVWSRQKRTTQFQPAAVRASVSGVVNAAASSSSISTTRTLATVKTAPSVSSADMSTGSGSADSVSLSESSNVAGGSTFSAESRLKTGQMLLLPGNMIVVTSDSGTGFTASLQQPPGSSSAEENSVKTKLRTALTTRNLEAQVELCHKLPLPPYDPFTITQDSSSSEDSRGGKLNKLRERNRAAAARCREKKKKFMSEMEIKYYDVEQQNAVMQQQMAQLRSEVAHLKSLLLLHKDCPVTRQLSVQQAMVQSDADGDDIAVIEVIDAHSAHAQQHDNDDDVSYQ